MEPAAGLEGLNEAPPPGLSRSDLVADAALASAIGLGAALAIGLLARLVARKALSPRRSARAALDRLRHLEGEERQLAQARLLNSLGPDGAAALARLREHIYRPADATVPDPVMRELETRLRSR